MKKVLVVEDNQDNLRLISYALKRKGYQVLTAEDGLSGLQIALREKPYFIVMDINLPVLGGLEATRRIRQSEGGEKVPIVALTSCAMYGDRKRIMDAGCNAYFEKPFDPLTIVDKIHEVLGISGHEPSGHPAQTPPPFGESDQ